MHVKMYKVVPTRDSFEVRQNGTETVVARAASRVTAEAARDALNKCAVLPPVKDANAGPTEDAYMQACRALHWRTAELKAHGIEPLQLTDDMPHRPSPDFEFVGVVDNRELEDEISDAISDTFDEDWTAGEGARNVVKTLFSLYTLTRKEP